MAGKRAVAVVPARGGSVSVPLKNIKELGGRPLLDWCVRSALDSGVFAEVWVSTDHDGIAAAAERSGARVHRRAPETATNTASTESALVDFANAHPEFDVCPRADSGNQAQGRKRYRLRYHSAAAAAGLASRSWFGGHR
ncbi:unnamed protein product [Prorocentrum cordatum]|uniref:N-acylneuraminate cytidylyltransferase n=1 Tax=Prorocentrum cordatum TaxID=2364126 RepID=A0ABN9SF44_9DINO|nr:unnamed protein product [Polarella glacialis]